MARVLIVDDDSAGLEIRKLILERRGHQVRTALEPISARTQFQTETPDVVILDLRVPHPEDGRALIREFHAASPGTRLIVLCGNDADLDGRQEASMVHCILTKPLHSELLLNAITDT
jgi:DNA-binding NtrC family response regulator